MRLIKAEFNNISGHGFYTWKVMCPFKVDWVSADTCCDRFCRANRGIKKVLKANQDVESWEVLCGYEDMA